MQQKPHTIDASHLAADYMQQNSSLTSQEGLAEFYHLNPKFTPRDPNKSETDKFFHLHDSIHIVFGCTTSYEGEFMADTSAMFGSDVGIIKYLSYTKLAYSELEKELAEVSVRQVFKSVVSSTPQTIVHGWHCFRLKKKWPWENHKAFEGHTLASIRTELGIKVSCL